VANVKSYFESHSHAYHHEPGFYFKVKNKIKEYTGGQKINVLDVGCGDGYFLNELIDLKIDATFYGFDVSAHMLDLTREKLKSENVVLFIADGFMLPLKDEIKFDVIHLDSVLHHMITKTRSASLNLSIKLIDTLISRLNNQGMLIIEEVNFESHIFSSFASQIVFYGCKLMNLLRLDLSRIIPELRPGLEVNFLDRSSLEKMLSNFCGQYYLFQKDLRRIPMLYRLFMLKDNSHIVYIFEKRQPR
jgi:SAM-dependent methyltransferase